jgi:phosphoribosyl-AMP cyclohydrolase
MEQIEKLFDEIKFDARGLVPAIIQDAGNNEVLMLGFMNRESIMQTLLTGKTHFWSRSRERLWMKGETSGHIQEVEDVRIDCDGDTLLIRVKQIEAACHTGYRSCFFRKWSSKTLEVIGEKVFEEKDVYGE